MRKLTVGDLRRIILQETRSLRRPRAPQARSLVSILFEAEEEGADKEAAPEQADASGFAQVSTQTNIAKLDRGDAYAQLASGDEDAPLIKAMKDATGWSAGAIKGAGGAEAIKKWAEGVGETELTARIKHISDQLPSGAPAKQDMPALEGGDADVVADAISSGGNFTVDLESDYAGDSEDFDAWYAALSDEDKKSFAAGKVPGDAVEEGLARSVSALFEKKWPRDGMGPLKGAPTKGEKSDPANKKELTDRALAFLVKGQLDGNDTDDNVKVKTNGTMPNSKMIPTQSNILAGKSLLFAFLQAVGASDLSDMGGAFVTTGNEILDGHHRWSGAYIGTGGGLEHSGVNIVTGDADALIPLLVSVGNAIGRPQKGVEDEKKESVRSAGKRDNLIMERWRSLAGIL